MLDSDFEAKRQNGQPPQYDLGWLTDAELMLLRALCTKMEGRHDRLFDRYRIEIQHVAYVPPKDTDSDPREAAQGAPSDQAGGSSGESETSAHSGSESELSADDEWSPIVPTPYEAEPPRAEPEKPQRKVVRIDTLQRPRHSRIRGFSDHPDLS